jgi:hypothetical protein
MITQAIGDFLWFPSGGNYSVAGTQSVFCDEGAKTTGSASNEPITHFQLLLSATRALLPSLLDELMPLINKSSFKL